LVAALPRPVWRVLAADSVSAVGSGLTLPFLVVYLHARGLGLGTAGGAAACLAAAGLAGNPAGGWLADRAGPSRAVVVGLLVAAAGAGLLAVVGQPWQAFPAAALAGLAAAIAWPAQDTLLARLAGAATRSTAFAVRHLTLNAGLGIGAALAAFVVDTGRPGTFVALYLLDAASFGVAALLLLGVTAPLGPDAPAEPRSRHGYRELLADAAFVRVWVLAAVLITVGYGAFSFAFPAVATGVGGQSATVLAVAYTANTITVVVAQLSMLRVLGGRCRTAALGWVAAAWAGTWVLVLVGGQSGTGCWFLAAAITFAVGEVLLAPTLPGLINDLAPERLRGRYSGGLTLAYTAGFIAGPLVCAQLLDRAGPVVLGLALVGG
jgi:MFS family permease